MDVSSGDSSTTPGFNVILEPSEYLTFHLQSNASPQSKLSIRNTSADRIIAFKVKTTRPLRYLVRPNQGMLLPDGSASIVVSLQQKDCEELFRLDPSERQTLNDKFLVQSIYIENSFYESVRTRGSKETADVLTQMWLHTDKSKLSNKKLRCRFVQDSIENNGSKVQLETQPTATYLSTGSRDVSISPRSGLSTSHMQSSFRESNTETSERREFKDNELNTKSSVQEVASLRKKYDELVAFTVQLTAQRDVLLSDLEKTRQHLQRATTDVQRHKKLAEEGQSLSSLRNRKPGQTSNSNSAEEVQSTGKLKSIQNTTAFGLFHILVCAILFFLIGRYY
uniref:Uncharacterized protein AlNc14C60G4426 n=1 Tax=Albugo laibachii Nc14 TaxID=890382 RepID=F0WCP4_9STRA|nr:conserved hypothetical protein [Albugo laibachii Nc14]|eukprot:CCA18965.1 conserved hypothetical protein [Albugo laibachii Nc14]